MEALTLFLIYDALKIWKMLRDFCFEELYVSIDNHISMSGFIVFLRLRRLLPSMLQQQHLSDNVLSCSSISLWPH